MSETEFIKDYLQTKGYTATLECFERENAYKTVEKNNKKVMTPEKESCIQKLINSYKEWIKKFYLLKQEYSNSEKKRYTILQCARQLFSIVVNCIEELQNISESTENIIDNIKMFIDKYKTQIGKYHQILLNDEWDSRADLITKEIISEHKKILWSSKLANDIQKIIEILLSLRLHALKTNPELRKNLISELVKNDILFITSTKSTIFIKDILNIHSYNIRHGILSFISIIVSTQEGVEYITKVNYDIIQKIIEIVKGTEDGQVLQRFCLAILQKVGSKNEIISLYLKYGLIDWIIKFLQRSRINKKINSFCLNYASALLANILKSDIAINFLENNNSVCRNLIETFLTMIDENNTATDMLKYILMCLGYLNIEKFSDIKAECRFLSRGQQFYENIGKVKTNSEEEEINKFKIMELCKYVFKIDNKGKNENFGKNNSQIENIIKEYECKKDSIVFECFQDEIN